VFEGSWMKVLIVVRQKVRPRAFCIHQLHGAQKSGGLAPSSRMAKAVCQRLSAPVTAPDAVLGVPAEQVASPSPSR
jgi:hypothetical protein